MATDCNISGRSCRTEVRVTRETHPLFGRLLAASGFKRLRGTLYFVVTLPDRSVGTIPADATNLLGDRSRDTNGPVLSAEGFRQLRMLAGPLRETGSTARDANRLTSSQYAPTNREVSPFRALRIAAPVQPTLTLTDELCDARDRWRLLPEDSRRQVLALLARLIARGIVEEGEQR